MQEWPAFRTVTLSQGGQTAKMPLFIDNVLKPVDFSIRHGIPADNDVGCYEIIRTQSGRKCRVLLQSPLQLSQVFILLKRGDPPMDKELPLARAKVAQQGKSLHQELAGEFLKQFAGPLSCKTGRSQRIPKLLDQTPGNLDAGRAAGIRKIGNTCRCGRQNSRTDLTVILLSQLGQFHNYASGL